MLRVATKTKRWMASGSQNALCHIEEISNHLSSYPVSIHIGATRILFLIFPDLTSLIKSVLLAVYIKADWYPLFSHVRQSHHIVTYLQNTYFKKNGFEYFRILIHLLCLIEICLVTKLLLKIWSIYQTSHSIH